MSRLTTELDATDLAEDIAEDLAGDIARHIRRLALLVRHAAHVPPPLSGVGAPKSCASGSCTSGSCAPGAEAALGARCATGPGWWVLAQGGPLDENDFEARERAREALLERVRKAGVLVGENVWVWDLSGRAQLVLSTLPTLERARRVATRLRAKGLAIVVRREMPEGFDS